MIAPWLQDPVTGSGILLVGTALITLFIVGLNRVAAPLPNPGLLYLPLVAMLAYHWGWHHAAIAGLLALACVYLFFLPPAAAFKPLTPRGIEQLVTLAAVMAFVLGLVQLARSRRSLAEREAGRFAALHRVGTALASELHEAPLLHLIARTARELTGAEFAAFTLRPTDAQGQPLVPAEGQLFYLAAAVGVSPEQEAFFQRTPLGGAGLLAPIFHHGVPVRVPDALALKAVPEHSSAMHSAGTADGMVPSAGSAQVAQGAAQQAAPSDAPGLHDQLPQQPLHYLGVPRGHPTVRSFLGAPLLDREGWVRGGLLLGHTQPDQFTADDEALLVALAAQAAVALENARLYQAAWMQARELDATFESIADGVTLVDNQGHVLQENGAAQRVREALEHARGPDAITRVLQHATARAHREAGEDATTVTIADGHGGDRIYVVSVAPLQPLRTVEAGSVTYTADAKQDNHAPRTSEEDLVPAETRPPAGTVIVWHDVTETHRLLAEQRAHAEAEARRSLLQTVVEALPSAVYLVRGPDARLVLANRAAADVWGAPWPEGQPMGEFLTASGTRLFGADGRPLAVEELATLRTVRSGEAVRHYQEVIRHPDARALPILLNAVPLDAQVLGGPTSGAAEAAGPAQAAPASADGTPLRPVAEPAPERAALVVLQDVSALKEAEQLKDEFIGIAAHELRTPMAAVRGFAQTLTLQTARGHGPPLDDWQREAIAAIDLATTRLVELTDDLLDVTRLQGGRLALRLEPTDLAALARRVVARLQVTSERHALTLTEVPEPVVALVDAARMEQVLANLIANAIKYSPEGGPIVVGVRADPEAGMAELSVRDHGIGIPAQQQSRIFGRFARADNARDLGITGTGLGLYLSRELVERQGGRIWFASAEGQGSTFFVALPLFVEVTLQPGEAAALSFLPSDIVSS
jgi:signal transduction histidine kinase/GAF domain-containing protein